MKTKNSSRQRYFRLGAYCLLAGLLGYTIFVQRGAIVDATRVATRADTGWLIASVVAFAGSVVLSAVMYQLLARRLRFSRTLEVQTAGLFANKLLPAGTGAMGVSFLYLRRNKFSTGSAGVIVAANNFLGLVGHLLLVSSLLLLRPDVVSQVVGEHYSSAGLLAVAALGIIVVTGLLLTTPASRRWLFANLSEVRRLLNHWYRLVAAVGVSMTLTACYALSLLLAARAIGVDISLAEAFVILTFSVAAASVLPTPGGIGSAEAGAYFGLKIFGVPDDLALAVAILYRFVTFWLPLLVGSAAFWDVSRRGFILKKL